MEQMQHLADQGFGLESSGDLSAGEWAESIEVIKNSMWKILKKL